MRSIILSMLLALAAGASSSAATAADATCSPIPGWDQFLARTAVRWIVIGELHGTAETPAIFADAVCLTAERRGRVIVALEMPAADQRRLDAFINSDGGTAAKTDFFKALLWHVRDGRSSEAFFGLFERLRQLHRKGRVARVVAFQADLLPQDPPGDQGPYETRMAATVREAGAPGATVVALVGSLHAMRTEVNFGKPFMPMASHLPGAETLTLNALGNGGAAWNCSGPTPADCGPHENRAPAAPRLRGVELQPQMDGAYDGVLNLGVPTTASPPQPVS